MSEAATKPMKKSAARLGAVQALYQMDLAQTPVNDVFAEFESHWLGQEVEDDELFAHVKAMVC